VPTRSTERTVAIPRLRSRRLRVTAVIGAVAVALGALGGVAATAVAPQRAAAAGQGCGYADSSANNGQYAGTICWFDFSGFNQTEARTTAGQPMQVTLQGGYVAKFDVKLTDVSGTLPMTMAARSTPLETRFAFGTDAYRGVPGLDTLYSNPAPTGLKGAQVTFDNIQVVDSAGAAVSGYSFVAADTEDNVRGESFTWTSDKPLNEIERLAPNGSWGCKTPIGLGTTQISCAGTGAGGSSIAGGKSTALLVAADTPETFAAQWETPQQSGIAIGIQTARLTLDKQVSGRVDPADSFDIAVTSPEGTLAGAASTGTGDTATTGGLVVLPRSDGGGYTMSETATATSPALLSNYAESWSCVNAASSSTTALPSGSGISKTVAPAIGDDITCTLTNTALPGTLTVVKHAAPAVDVNGDGLTDAGDTIQYTFTVTNTGQLTMSNIGVTDDKVGAVSCPASTLAPGASEDCTADQAYVVTASDVDHGSVDNTATAHGTPPGSDVPRTSEPSSTSTPTTAPAPSLSVVKSADPSDADSYRPGQVITYIFAVTNTGNVTVNGIHVVESVFSGTDPLSDATCESTTLAPGAQTVCTTTYTLTSQDVDNGSVTNTADAEGTSLGSDTPVTSNDSTVTIPETPAPGITVVKSANPTTVTKAGQTVTYSFVVTNTGNVTLTGVAVDETSFSGSGDLPKPDCPTTTLVAGQVETCTTTYAVTQADVDAGSVTNRAAVRATPPDGVPLEPVPSNEVTVDIPASPALSVAKSADVTAGAVGEKITYTFTVTNTGNVTITDPQVTDVGFTGDPNGLSAVMCPLGPIHLSPGQVETCTATYTVTQADVDAGSISNRAEVIGTPPDGDPIPPVTSDPVVVPTNPHAALSLVKTAGTQQVTRIGEVVTYRFAVTNTGNVTIKDPTVKEGTFTGHGSLSPVKCPSVSALAPGDEMDCTAMYTVDAADLASNGTLSNTATVTGSTTGGDPITSDPSTSKVTEVGPAAPMAGLASTGSDTWTAGLVGLGMLVLGLLAASAAWLQRRSRLD
jgi:uncharacterized repeat protein (TIGR01451 family)